MNSEDIAEVSKLIERDLGLNETALIVHDSFDEFKDKLTQIIRSLLDKDFEKLLHAMYRIDIGEEKLKSALALNLPDQIAPDIAQLIINRELQKVATRRKYRS